MRQLTKMPFLLTSLFSLSAAVDILTPDRPLLDGETMISANGIFALGFFTPSNGSKNRYAGIWYNKISTQIVVWVANRNKPIAGSNASLSITSNGILVVTDNDFTVMWSSSSTATTVSNPIAQIQDTGNFIVKDADNGNSQFYAWQSFDYPTDTLLPGMKLGWNLTTGLNRNLTSWARLTDPSTGSYNLIMDISGDPQMFLRSGTTRTWRSGPWNGEQFSGIPRDNSMFTFNFVQNSEEVYYQYYLKDPTVISRLIVNKDGSLHHLIGLHHLIWSASKDQCDRVSPCGPFGVCNPNDSPICACVQGFVPQNQGNWDLSIGTDGCVRKTPLVCRNGTERFLTITEVKLPDTSSSTVDMSLNRDQCMARCLANCSCTAYASVDINGSGCLIWTSNLTDLRVLSFGGQDLYVRLAAVDLGSAASDQSHKKGIKTVAIVLPIILGIALLTWICCCCIRRKRILGTISFTNPYNNDGSETKDLELPLFDLCTIVAATDSFSIDNKLGEGGFGPVYKGILEDGQEIAVKRLAKASVQGTDELKNEMILIAKLQHRNLVRLLGCCVQGEERMLIYEYMPNRSLDFFLFDRARCVLLDWQRRYSIIMGIARGLLYLHQDSRLRIIHRDLKASNILIDKEMNAKISDFGLARIFGENDTEGNTGKIVGTYGYMSPEYAMDGIFSVKSDVFSFGVLVLEIVSGKKNRGVYLVKPDMNLLGRAWSLWREGKSLELVDESIAYSFPLAEATRCIMVGLLCVQEHPEDRPTMSSVVLMLSSENAMLPEPKQPGFVTPRGHLKNESSRSKQGSSTVNEISITMLEGR